MIKQSNSNRIGFTIVELLIVIVIIGILAAITVAAYNGIQQRGRDAQRKSDLALLSRYVKMYTAENGTPPSTTAGCYAAKSFISSGCESYSSLTDLTKYITKLPVDPINTTDYGYQYRRGYRLDASGTNIESAGSGDYVILGRLESSDQPAFTFGASTYNYILTK